MSLFLLSATMGLQPPRRAETADAGPLLQVYLLGLVEFEAALALQRLLVYHVAGDRDRAALVLCEHPPLITVGRQGSRGHILCDADELKARRWSVRWVNRGGGCLLHLPGQLAVYPILALDRLGLGLRAYLDRLEAVLADVLADFQIPCQTRPGQAGLWVGSRPIATIGVAVRDWVTYFGAALNVNPDLGPFRLVRCGGPEDGPMTSLERERRGPLRPSLVRERLLEHFAARFGFDRTALFFGHPALGRMTPSDAVTAGR
ncbi:MAG TPA: lipoyl(octanoyl) transferase LipB [Gemmataceae bacterium]|nr:lipoyl(octanoyl) transferase LipB [Gemmataceae bacterium]